MAWESRGLYLCREGPPAEQLAPHSPRAWHLAARVGEGAAGVQTVTGGHWTPSAPVGGPLGYLKTEAPGVGGPREHRGRASWWGCPAQTHSCPPCPQPAAA